MSKLADEAGDSGLGVSFGVAGRDPDDDGLALDEVEHFDQLLEIERVPGVWRQLAVGHAPMLSASRQRRRTLREPGPPDEASLRVKRRCPTAAPMAPQGWRPSGGCWPADP
jgi:hypothetical protein